MLKKRVVAAVAAALVAGGASAVSVNPGNKGEVLLAPMVMVAGGWESEIRLVNSDTVNSTVVKLSFHEQIQSAEVLDFFVYLSPGDVWRGTAKKQADGRFGIDSDDDSSLYVSSGTNRCPAGTATSVGFTADKVKSSVPADFTYLTVFQARTFSPATTVSLNGIPSQLGSAPVDKAKILRAYSDACVAGETITSAMTSNALSGDVTLRNAANGNVLSLPMTALQDYNNSVYHKTGQYTTFGSNPTVADPVLGPTTRERVEDALWANDFVIPFNLTPGNMTYATVTFPTKETYVGNFTGSQYFGRIAGATPQVSLVARNEKEETIASTGCFVSPCAVDPTNSIPFELNVLALSTAAGSGSSSQVNTSGFTRGWVSMNLQAVPSVAPSAPNYNNVGDQGAPALVTVIQWEQKGSSLQGSWSYAAKTQNPN